MRTNLPVHGFLPSIDTLLSPYYYLYTPMYRTMNNGGSISVDSNTTNKEMAASPTPQTTFFMTNKRDITRKHNTYDVYIASRMPSMHRTHWTSPFFEWRQHLNWFKTYSERHGWCANEQYWATFRDSTTSPGSLDNAVAKSRQYMKGAPSSFPSYPTPTSSRGT